MNHGMVHNLNHQDQYEKLRAKGYTPPHADDAIANVTNQQAQQIDRSDMLDSDEDSEIDWTTNSVVAPPCCNENESEHMRKYEELLADGRDEETAWQMAILFFSSDKVSEDHQVAPEGIVLANAGNDMLGDSEIDWASWSSLPGEAPVRVEARPYVNNCDKAKAALKMADRYTKEAERALDANNNHDGIDRDDMLDPNEEF